MICKWTGRYIYQVAPAEFSFAVIVLKKKKKKKKKKIDPKKIIFLGTNNWTALAIQW